MAAYYDVYHKDPAFEGKPLVRIKSNGRVVEEYIQGTKKLINDMLKKLKRGIIVEESLDFTIVPVLKEKNQNLFERFGNFSREIKAQYRHRSSS